MQKVSILHLITAAKNASPFDVNMAFDAGFDKIMPYTDVALDEVTALTQDAMFSRSPSGIKSEGLFFGGRDIHLAIDMQKLAKSAMFSPFEMSTFADPSGAFTTAAAMLAKIDAALKAHNQTWQQQTIAIFGASGTVGTACALIAANQGATILLVAHRNIAQTQALATQLQQQYGLIAQAVDGTTDIAKTALLQNATIAVCAAAAGVRVLESRHFIMSNSLKIMADVNAVAPTGVERLDVMSDGSNIANTKITGFGALAVGQLKYITQQKMLQHMLSAQAPVHLDYNHAFDIACAAI